MTDLTRVTIRDGMRGGDVRRRNWVLVLAAPLLLSGCGVLDTLTGSSGTGSGSGAATSPTGPAWIVHTAGSPTPPARPSFPAASPTPTPATGFLPRGVPAPTRTPAVTCPPRTFNFSKIGSADVSAGATSAVVSWFNVGGSNLVEFRITAISQDLAVGKQRDVGWKVVPPRTPCGRMSATIPGLDRRTGYVFSVDAVVLRRSGDGTHAATIARSQVIRTS